MGWSAARVPAGSRRAATSPMSPNTASAAIAQAYAVVPVATTETRMVPAIAVPNDEPRLETLRDSPEISPCSSSGKLDWTTFTRGVSIAPTPRPMSARPGTNAQMLSEPLTSTSRSTIPAMVTTKPVTIRVFCGNRLASRSAAREEARMPSVAAVKTTPVLIAL